jgi:hypothetical protein
LRYRYRLGARQEISASISAFTSRHDSPELLRVLDRPEIPLHTNGSKSDIRLNHQAQDQWRHLQRRWDATAVTHSSPRIDAHRRHRFCPCYGRKHKPHKRQEEGEIRRTYWARGPMNSEIFGDLGVRRGSDRARGPLLRNAKRTAQGTPVNRAAQMRQGRPLGLQPCARGPTRYYAATSATS